MTDLTNFNIGDWIIISNKYLGCIYKKIWNNNGLIVKLDNDTNYQDDMIKQYNLLPNMLINGYKIITPNNQITIVNSQTLGILFNSQYQNSEYFELNLKLKNSFTNFINKIQPKKINKIINPQIVNNIPKLSNILDIKHMKRYNENTDDSLPEYISLMVSKLFMHDKDPTHIEYFNSLKNNETSAEDYLGEENINQVIKPALKFQLEKFDIIYSDQYYDFKKTLMYKHLIYDVTPDMTTLGQQFISQIKSALIAFQIPLVTDDGSKLLENVNLFDFIKFTIRNGYIEITNKFTQDNQIITKDLISNLNVLSGEYLKSINYQMLTKIILENKNSHDLGINNQIVQEALNILAQEYLICFQPQIELLLWTICRLLIAWYCDPILYKQIFKIKILINLYRARGLKELNKDIGIEPLIIIQPKYGKKSALQVISHLSYLFFSYKKIGWEESPPSYFNKIDSLIYYTNGSIDLKKYIKILLKAKTINNDSNPLSTDLTKIKINNSISNDLEYELKHK